MAKMRFLPPDQWRRYVEYRLNEQYGQRKVRRRNFSELGLALDELAEKIANGQIVT